MHLGAILDTARIHRGAILDKARMHRGAILAVQGSLSWGAILGLDNIGWSDVISRKIDFSGIEGLFVHVWGIQSRRK